MEKKVKLPRIFDRLAVQLPLCIVLVELLVLIFNRLYQSYKINSQLDNMNVHVLSHSNNYIATYILIILMLILAVLVLAITIKNKISSN